MRHHPPSFRLICGPMFAGKSTALRRYIERAARSMKKVDVVFHVVDKRSNGVIKTHGGLSSRGLKVGHRVVKSSHELFHGIPQGTNVLVVEEGQFFDIDLPLYIPKILDLGISVFIGGLDLTSEGDPFGPMGHLLAMADTVEKITAICPCGEEATRTLCLTPKTEAVRVGGADEYSAACYACWRNKGVQWHPTATDPPSTTP